MVQPLHVLRQNGHSGPRTGAADNQAAGASLAGQSVGQTSISGS